MFDSTRLRPLQRPFRLESGVLIKAPVVAFEEYGSPTAPAILIAHGGLSNQHAAGTVVNGGVPGWWDGLIGPGRAFDTDRYRVIAMNALGSMFGTTGPQSLDPDSGQPYGPSFPALTLRDMVRFQKAFLDELGVDHLVCMAGPSMGSMQTLTMAALYPEFVGSLVAVATAGRLPPMALLAHHYMMQVLKGDPAFNGGAYGRCQPTKALSSVFQFGRIFYGHEASARKAFWDTVAESPAAQKERSEQASRFLMDHVESRTRDWDANSIITLLSAINTHDLGYDQSSYAAGVRRILCPALLMNIDTDQEFPINWAEDVAGLLNEVRPGQACVQVIESDYGHLGCVVEVEQIDTAVRRFFRHHAIDQATACRTQKSLSSHERTPV